MYNAHAFFAADVLVHVGAPVREVALHGKRYTFSASPPPLRTLPCVHFHPSSSPASLSLPSPPPASRHSSFLPPARTFAIGPWYRPTSTYTAYSNEPGGLSDVSRQTNWILKIKKRRDGGPRVVDPPKRTDPRTNDRALHEPLDALVSFLCAHSDPSSLARLLRLR